MEIDLRSKSNFKLRFIKIAEERRKDIIISEKDINNGIIIN